MQSTMANFHIDTDKIAIGRINESLSTLQQARDLRIREAESALKSRHSYQNILVPNMLKHRRIVPEPCDNVTAIQ